MKLIINGQERDSEARTLSELLRAEGLAEALQDGNDCDPKRPRVALAQNGALVRRQLWESTPLADGDAIEIVTAVGGG
ncbi:sulfur carrier protein ThiS [Rhodovibrionaceae bacterium A322]